MKEVRQTHSRGAASRRWFSPDGVVVGPAREVDVQLIRSAVFASRGFDLLTPGCPEFEVRSEVGIPTFSLYFSVRKYSVPPKCTRFWHRKITENSQRFNLDAMDETYA
jgi:hypothetical protein